MKSLLLVLAVVCVGCGTTTSVKTTPRETFTNTLGMKFVSVPGTGVQFCIWETRVKDYTVYALAHADGVVDTRWKNPRLKTTSFTQEETHPVVNVNWNDAQDFCWWLTKKELAAGSIKTGQKYRLPTDDEWSVAVGMGKETGRWPRDKQEAIREEYPWGKRWPPPKAAMPTPWTAS